MNNALGGLCVSSRERVSPKLVESIPIIHHPWPKITKEGNSQETAREYAPIHCNHPCIIKRCFGAVRGALGSILLPPKGIRPNNSHPKELERGHKKNDQKIHHRAASTASKSLRTILGEVGIFRQEGVRLLDALLDCRWESHDDWCLYVCGCGYYYA